MGALLFAVQFATYMAAYGVVGVVQAVTTSAKTNPPNYRIVADTSTFAPGTFDMRTVETSAVGTSTIAADTRTVEQPVDYMKDSPLPGEGAQ